MSNKPVIFLAFANEMLGETDYLRNLSIESRRLRETLEKAVRAGLCEVVERSNTTAGDIFGVFQDPQYRNRIGIFHYGGHANGYQLLLESAAGEVAAADAGGLAAFLAQQQGLQLVVLNGCSTRQQTQGLLEANVPAVISTSRDIDDQVATDFAAHFYQGLAGGATIRTAYSEARAAAQTAAGGNTRALFHGVRKGRQGDSEPDGWPWGLYLREGSEAADQWNLPQAVDDPLFGLPELPEQDLPESPYRHLHWFTHRDADVFFGRGHQVRELYDRLTAPHTAPIMLFYGQSGVGKSSVLDAGLIPRLAHNCEVRYVRRSTDGLLSTLKEALGGSSAGEPVVKAEKQEPERLGKQVVALLDEVREDGGELPGKREQLLSALQTIFSEPGHYLRDTATRLLEKLGSMSGRTTSEQAVADAWIETEERLGRPLIVFLDQVEELFTHPGADGDDELQALLEELESTFSNPDRRPRGRLVLGFRKEWLAELEARLVSHELPRTKVFLEPLDRRGIIEAVEGPTRSQRLREHYGLSVEDNLAEIIADDLLEDRDSSIAPTLQILLTKMWAKATEENREKPRFTQALYQDLKRDGILLRDFLNQQIEKCRESDPSAVNSGLLLDLLALHTTALGTAGQCDLERLQQQYAHLGDRLPNLLQKCQDLHLLTVAASPDKADSKKTRLAHDTLAPLVREQFDESDLPGQRARRVLGNRSVDWEQGQTGNPLDEADLALVEQGLTGTRALNDTEQRLVAASREQRARRERQLQRRKAFNMLAVGAIAAAGLFGWWQWGNAETQRALTEQKEKMLQAELHKDNPVFGRMITREVPGRPRGWAAIAADLHTFRVPEIYFNPGPDRPAQVSEVAFGARGTFATGDAHDEVWLWRPDDAMGMKPFPACPRKNPPPVCRHESFLWDVEFSLDGRHMASADNDGIVKLWTIGSAGPPSLRQTLEHESEGSALRVRMNSDGGVVAVLNENAAGRAVVLWRIIEPGKHERYLIANPASESGQVKALAVSPDGTQLLLGYSSGTVWLRPAPWVDDREGSRLLDPTQGEEPGEAAESETPGVLHVTFDEHGKRMASADAAGAIHLWDSSVGSDGELALALGWQPIGLRIHSGRLFVAGENNVYVAGLDDAGESPPFVPEFYKANIRDADFDGQRFITALERHDEVSIWNVGTRPEPRALSPSGDACTDHRAVDLAYLEGDSLLVAYERGTVRLWSSLAPPGPGEASSDAGARERVIPRARDMPGCKPGATPIFDGQATAIAASGDNANYAVAFSDGRIVVGAVGESTSPKTEAEVFGAVNRPRSTDHESAANIETCRSPVVRDAKGEFTANVDVSSAVWSIAFDRSAPRIVAGYQDGRVRILDVPARKWVEVGSHEKAVCAVDWAGDGSALASASLDGRVKIWPLSGGETAGQPATFEHRSAVHSVAFDGKSKRVVTGAEDATVRLLELERSETLERGSHFDGVSAAVFSPAGDWILSGGGDVLGMDCLGQVDGAGPTPCEPDADMVEVAASNETDLEKLRAVAIAPSLPQFATIDDAGILRLFRSDYRVAFWEEQSECMPVEKRAEILGEDSEQAAAGHARCRELTGACGESRIACEQSLRAHSLYQNASDVLQ